MPTTIMTDVFTLEELEALGNERAVERALDWMAEAWADVAVEQTTDTIDETLDALCGSSTSLDGRRTGPITWHEWDYHRMFLTLDVWLRPESLRPVEGEFGGDHPLAGLPNLPHADLVELVEVNGRSRDLTVHGKDADLTEQQQQDIAETVASHQGNWPDTRRGQVRALRELYDALGLVDCMEEMEE